MKATSTKVKVTKKPNYDIYLGRGNGVARRLGNRNYRKTIKLHKERYQQTKGNKQKARVAVDVTHAFESKGATFYYKPQKGKDWEVAPRSKVLKTIKQALREKASTANKSEDEEKKKMGRITINGETMEAALWELSTSMPDLGDSPPNELRQTANFCQQQQASPQEQQYPSLFLDSSRTDSGGIIDNASNNNNNEANDEDHEEETQNNKDPKWHDDLNEPVQAHNEGKMLKDISIRSMLGIESIRTFVVGSIESFQQDYPDSDSDSDSEESIQPADPMFLSEVRRKKSSVSLIDNESADYVQRKTIQNIGNNEEEKSTVFKGEVLFKSLRFIEQEIDPLYYRAPPQHQEVDNDGSDSEDALQPAKPTFLNIMRAKDVSMLSFCQSDKEIKSAYSEVDAPPAPPSNNLPSKSKDASFRDMLDKALDTPSFLDRFQGQIVDDAEEHLTPSKPVFLKDSSMQSFRSKNTGTFDMSEVNLEDSLRSLNLKTIVNKEVRLSF